MNAPFGPTSPWVSLTGGTGEFLATAWAGVATHLWESTLFLALVALLSLSLGRAPGALRNQLWSLALLKLFVPVSALGWVWERWLSDHPLPLGSQTALWLEPIWSSGGTNGIAAGASTIVLGASIVWTLVAAVLVSQTIRAGRESRPSLASVVTLDQADRIATLSRDLGLPKGRIRVSNELSIPCVIGILRPAIYLPAEVLSRPWRELRAIALHEHAHVRRRDPLRLLVQRTAFVLFFYYPPLWLVLNQLHRTAELACDEEAVGRGADARDLGRAIARSVRTGLSASSPVSALGSPHRPLLAERLRRLQTDRRYRTMHYHRAALFLAAASLMGLALVPRTSPVDTAIAGTGDAATSALHDSQAKKEKKAPRMESGNASASEESKAIDSESNFVPPKPVADKMVFPAYPEEYRSEGATGLVLLFVNISEHGEVTSVKEKQGVSGHPAFTESAITAVSQWVFEPATEDGEPVATEVVIPIKFALE
ncbi:MAG: M56 family metallopeptidase [Candidatus Eisenbacteria bacterium]